MSKSKDCGCTVTLGQGKPTRTLLIVACVLLVSAVAAAGAIVFIKKRHGAARVERHRRHNKAV